MTVRDLFMFLAVLMAVASVLSVVADFVLRDRKLSRRVDDEFRQKQRDAARQSSLFKNRGEAADLGAEETKPTLDQRFRTMVEQSGVGLTPEQLLMVAAGAALALGVFGLLLRSNWLVAVAGAAVGGGAPFLVVSVKQRAYLAKMTRQVPDALDLIARVLRAGLTVQQAMQAVADEFDAPLGSEFSYCYEQQKLGLPPETALRDLARRSGLLELKILVLAVLVQQQTGGNLAQLIENLATVVRERLRIQQRVRALTGEGRMQAAVLLALPPFMFVVMLFIRRDYAQELLARPHLLAGMGVSMTFGALWIRKIITLDV